MADTAHIAFKNIATGDRGIHAVTGELVMIAPGKSRTVEVTQAEAEGAPTEWFELTAPDGNGERDIGAAIDLLDSANDDHWTGAGLPAVDAVKAILGRDVTRAEINEAAPDFMRPAA